MRILIADDSELILERLYKMLLRYKQTEMVERCKNGTDALLALRTQPIDLAILDIRMPGLSGLEVMRSFKMENKKVKFIILTLNHSDIYRQLALQAGADYYFNKNDFESLSLLLDKILAKDEIRPDNNLNVKLLITD